MSERINCLKDLGVSIDHARLPNLSESTGLGLVGLATIPEVAKTLTGNTRESLNLARLVTHHINRMSDLDIENHNFVILGYASELLRNQNTNGFGMVILNRVIHAEARHLTEADINAANRRYEELVADNPSLTDAEKRLLNALVYIGSPLHADSLTGFSVGRDLQGNRVIRCEHDGKPTGDIIDSSLAGEAFGAFGGWFRKALHASPDSDHRLSVEDKAA